MRKFFLITIIILYAFILIAINLDLPLVSNFFHINKQNNKSELAIKYLTHKYHAVRAGQNSNYFESEFDTLLKKNIVFDSSVIDTFSLNGEDFLVVLIPFKDKNATGIFKYYPKRYWRNEDYLRGNIIIAAKIIRISETQTFKFLKYLEGIGYPFENRDEIFFTGSLIEFVNIS